MSSDTIKTGRLEVATTAASRGTRMKMDGQIDETCELTQVAEMADGYVEIDLERVTFINSVGVREWIRFLRTLSERRVTAALSHCSEAIVHQMNMITEARGDASILSFYAPYDCEECGFEATMLLDVRAHSAALQQGSPPQLPCPECSSAMGFSDLADRYLFFLNQA